MTHLGDIIHSSLIGGFLTGTTTDTGQTITGQTGDSSASFQQAANIFQNILSGVGLPQTTFERVTSENLIGLGEASIDISKALSEQVEIRERQRAVDNEALQNTQIVLGQVNERLSTQVQSLGKSIEDLSRGQFDPVKFFTDNPIIGGIGIGGLLIGGVILLVALK